MIINSEPFHKIGRESVLITMPTPEIILDESFDYGKYVEDYFRDTLEYRQGNYQGYFEDCEDIDIRELFDNDAKPSQINPKQNELTNNYRHEFYILQHQYENAYQKGYADEVNFEITKAMQRLASDYMTKLDTLSDTYELDKLSERQR